MIFEKSGFGTIKYHNHTTDSAEYNNDATIYTK